MLHREFLRTARALALLDHPNLAIGVLEANGDGPEPYVAFSVSDDRPLDGLGQRRDWLRSRDCLPYDNRRLALLVTDAARGLQVLHRAGLVHGNLRPTSLRLTARSGRLRLHDLPSMPLILEGRGDGPPGRDLADLAAAVAALVTGREAPPRAPRAAPSRGPCTANPGLTQPARLLGRCRATGLPDRARPGRRLDRPAGAVDPPPRHPARVGEPGRPRGSTIASSRSSRPASSRRSSPGSPGMRIPGRLRSLPSCG